VLVTVNRAGDTSTPASVDYWTDDGSATQKRDYMIRTETLTFGVGEASKSFSLFIVNDTYQEPNETFRVLLNNPIGTTIGSTSTATITINANDPTPDPIHPLDKPDALFFVRQHYLDFLNREPDSDGLNFWSGEITSCGNDQACITNKKINVSAAFFLSIEFQETGYLAYRTYQAAYGDVPGFAVINGVQTPIMVPRILYIDFIPDTLRLSAGVQVGIGNWQEQLENNKRAYMLAFVQRSGFQGQYPSSMTADEYVDKLNTRAGNVLSPDERTTLISILGATPNDPAKRAQVLRAVAEDQDLKTQQRNRAFVLMQYFGYLRRNPNDLPDTDYTGWKYWLDKLESHNGNFVEAEMVWAFLSSFEYRDRFGP
jgi:hypothetical protein